MRQPTGVTTQTRRAAGMPRQAHVSGDVADGADGRGGAGVSRYAAAQGCRPNKQVVPVYL